MALFTIGALLVGGFLTWNFIGALASLANVFAVIGGLTVFAGLTYSLLEDDLLDVLGFESQLLESLSALFIGATVGAVSYKLFEALFAVAGWGVALFLVVLGVAFFVRPILTYNIVVGLIGGILDLVGGE